MFTQNKYFLRLLAVIIMCFQYQACFCQVLIPKDSTGKIYVPHGVIFGEAYNINFNLSMSRYTPSISEIILAETIFLDQFNITLSKDKRTLGFVPIRNVRRKFKKYGRQYIGFVDSLQNHLVFIQLLNLNNSQKNINRSFNNWHQKFITGTGDFFESNTSRYLIDLGKREMRIY